MKKRPSTLLLTLLVLCVLTLACGLPAAVQPTSVDSTLKTLAPEAGQTAPPPTGDFNLPDAGIGLVGLGEYSSTLTTTFTGTRSGAPYQSTSVLTRQVSTDPEKASLTTLTSSGTDSLEISMIAAEIAGLNYLYSGTEQPCQAFSTDSTIEAFSLPDAPAQLPAITGAEKAGEENINGVTTTRYQFDERALADYPPGITASGDVWIAVDGGWVVQYELTLTAPENILGVNLAGQQTWQYQINPGRPLIAPPIACYDLPFDLPRMEDAAQVYMMPAYLEYLSGSSVDSIGLFYSDLTLEGWTMVNSTQGLLILKKIIGTDQIFVWVEIQPEGTKNRVKIMISKFSPENAEPMTETTPAAQATFDLTTSGLPEGVPIYANARDINGMADKFVTYQADASMSEIEEFYSGQLKSNGWALSMQASGITQWQKNGIMLFVQIIDKETTGVQVMITWMKNP